jgi:dihydrofolate synthase/folylpolyglutamate synthase
VTPAERPTPEQAERWLLSLELFGMRFGTHRMRRLMTVLEHPERAFRSIHVVGTNGKSSTTRMIAAILEAHGLRTGSYLSPHLLAYWERIRIGDRDLEPGAFAAAIDRARRAAEVVNRGAAEDDLVTQFELLTAAAYSEMARRGVEVAVVEAGLGGRYDATNVLPSEVQVLTSVGLEHTRWLGPTVEAIAREKLDVVQPGATLVLGPGMHEDAVAVAAEVAGERGAAIVRAPADPGLPIAARGAYQRRNFSVARTAAAALLGEGSLDPRAVARAASAVEVPGRLQAIDSDPLTLLDGAHNPDGVAALVESLPEIARPSQRVVGVVSILDDKDVAAMLGGLLEATDALVVTASRNPRALPPPTLASQVSQLGGPAAEALRDPVRALARARELAGPEGLVVVTGSIYLLADLLADRAGSAGRRASTM